MPLGSWTTRAAPAGGLGTTPPASELLRSATESGLEKIHPLSGERQTASVEPDGSDDPMGNDLIGILFWFLSDSPSPGKYDVDDACETVCLWNGGCENWFYRRGRIVYHCQDGAVFRGPRVA